MSQSRKSTKVKQGTRNEIHKTPGKDSSKNTDPVEFVESCLNCVRPLPSTGFDSKDQHVTCVICKRKTNHNCWQYRRSMCSKPPLDGKDLQGKKCSKNFSVKIPRVKAGVGLESETTWVT